jgi:ferredoxin
MTSTRVLAPMVRPAGLRLRVDRVACDGKGLCAEVLPELLRLDDWGFPILLGGGEVPDDVERIARRAVSLCPKLALHLDPAPRRRGEQAT